MQKIKDLINKEKYVYIILKNEEIAKRFLADAEAEGITFSDGSKPTNKAPNDIIALLQNVTICYAGFKAECAAIVTNVSVLIMGSVLGDFCCENAH